MIPVTGKTAILGIFGDPVVQARSPQLLNALMARHGIDAVLVPLHVAPDGLAAAVAGLKAIRSFKGVVVTMPHKQAIIPLLDDVAPEAAQVGACNIVRRDADGRLTGSMFDGEGFVAGLRQAGHEVRGRRVFMAGAGGAASGIAFALGKHGAAALTLHNRNGARAEALAARVRMAWPAMAVTVGTADPAGHDIVVNATSLGMKPDDALPLDVAGLTAGMVAAEIIMQPETTAFLAAGAARGCALHGGQAMLAAQLELMLEFLEIKIK